MKPQIPKLFQTSLRINVEVKNYWKDLNSCYLSWLILCIDTTLISLKNDIKMNQ